MTSRQRENFKYEMNRIKNDERYKASYFRSIYRQYLELEKYIEAESTNIITMIEGNDTEKIIELTKVISHHLRTILFDAKHVDSTIFRECKQYLEYLRDLTIVPDFLKDRLFSLISLIHSSVEKNINYLYMNNEIDLELYEAYKKDIEINALTLGVK